ncbi:MAG: VCBS repeat-containing protein [Acidimicrobiia bacterium]|nr:VCBS repeat-containing protein [Acidimicrobiia bacterium]
MIISFMRKRSLFACGFGPAARKRNSCWVALWVVTVACLSAGAGQSPFRVVDSGFDAFRSGEFGNAGQNLYVSRNGRIQFIHHWDLNGDGFYDFVLNTTHNRMDVPNAFVYLQRTEGFHSAISPIYDSLPLYEKWKQETRSRDALWQLEAVSPAGLFVEDLNRDGFPEVVFANRTDGFTSTSVSYVYWGSAQGYARRAELPTATATDVCAADLNHDGTIDLVFANQGWAHPSVGGYRDHLQSFIYWGSKQGYSATARSEVSTVRAVSCAVGDLDADGNPDLVFANAGLNESDLSIHWGTKTGIDFTHPTRRKAPGIRRVRLKRLAPFGWSLMTATEGSTEILRCNPARELIPALQLPIGSWAVAAADLDRDGQDDLALATKDSIQILWSKARFDVSQSATLPALSPRDVAIAQIDADLWPDIVVANHQTATTYDAPSFVYWGSEQGYSATHREELQTFGALAVAAGDVNQDGKSDLVFANTSSAFVTSPETRENALVYWGRARRGYSASAVTRYPVNAARGYSASAVTRYPVNAAMGSAMVDLDDDGHSELLFANMADESFVYRGTAEGPSPAKMEALAVPGSKPHNAFAVADVNRDGYLDVLLCGWVSATSGGATLLLWGGPSGLSVARSVKIEYPLKGVANIRLADLNNDGFLDLFLAASYDSHSAVLWGNGEGFSMARSDTIDQPYLSNAEFADLDGDGFLDWILCQVFDLKQHNYRAASRVIVRFGSKAGFDKRAPIALPAGGALDLVVADFDKNGGLDLGVAQYSGGTRDDLPFLIYWNEGKGKFSASNRTELPATGGTGGLSGDFDNDGFLDLLAINHISRGNHNVDSHVYWGSAHGFSIRERTRLPGFGPHWAQNVDIGNLYTRELQETFTSRPIAVPANVKKLRVMLGTETPRHSRLAVQVRQASTKEALAQQGWHVTNNEDVIWRTDDRWLQYQILFQAGAGGATPYLKEVKIEQVE